MSNRVTGGDTELENHLKTCSKNVSYISKTSHNELIYCLGKFIKDALIKDIKESNFFSILADEASDCSNQEQLCFVLRFVDKGGKIRDQFLGFLHFELGLSGKALAETILTEIVNLILDINNCQRQWHDRTASISGHIHGFSGHILRINEKALYTHCHNHQLNLVVAASCSIQYVRYALNQISSLIFLSQVKKC